MIVDASECPTEEEAKDFLEPLNPEEIQRVNLALRRKLPGTNFFERGRHPIPKGVSIPEFMRMILEVCKGEPDKYATNFAHRVFRHFDLGLDYSTSMVMT